MPLYVLQVAPPALGADWLATVPGQFLWHVTGISAQLATFDPTIPVAMLDRSGNARDGIYGASGDTTGLSFVPGIVPGDFAVQGVAGTVGEVVLTDDPFTGDFSVAWWLQFDAGSTIYTTLVASGPSGPTVRVNGQPPGFNLAFHLQRIPDAIHQDDFFLGSDPIDAAPHLYVWTYEAATDTGTFYFDGVLVGSRSFTPNPMTRVTDHLLWGSVGAGQTQTYDELTIFDYALGAGDVAALYAAGTSNFDAWAAIVSALAPFAWYALDDAAPSVGRTVVFEVTDGTRPLLDVGPGEPPSSSVGASHYSWTPTLASSQALPDLLTISVAIPDLILPAGYTIGTRTLDIGVLDQWSDVVVWWNSDVMDLANPPDPFVYAPGAYLNIITKGN